MIDDLENWNFMSSPKSKRFRTYLFSYQHNGAKWAFDIEATSPEDAKNRQAKIASASYDGELVASISIPDVRRFAMLRKMIEWLRL